MSIAPMLLFLFSGTLAHAELDLLDPTLADGFDFPIISSKSTAGVDSSIDGLHLESKEAWFGKGKDVQPLAAGLVTSVSDNQVWVLHRYVMNGTLRVSETGYLGIADCQWKAGDTVKRHQPMGKATGRVEVTLRHLTCDDGATTLMPVSKFVANHRQLLLPAKEPRIVIAIKHTYQLHVCEKGKVVQTFPIALGQEGRKRKRAAGDNGSPEGEYRITQKARGPFDGQFGGYLGAAWLRLNYPNAADARLALAEGRITKKVHDSIVTAAAESHLAPTSTALGDGIGIHGWKSDWPDGEHHLTWGCLSLREADLLKLYGLVQKGTRVLIAP